MPRAAGGRNAKCWPHAAGDSALLKFLGVHSRWRLLRARSFLPLQHTRRPPTIRAGKSQQCAPPAIAWTGAREAFRPSLAWVKTGSHVRCSRTDWASDQAISCKPSPCRSATRRSRPWHVFLPRREGRPSPHEVLDGSRVRRPDGGRGADSAPSAKGAFSGQGESCRDRRRGGRRNGGPIFGLWHRTGRSDTRRAERTLLDLLLQQPLSRRASLFRIAHSRL